MHACVLTCSLLPFTEHLECLEASWKLCNGFKVSSRKVDCGDVRVLVVQKNISWKKTWFWVTVPVQDIKAAAAPLWLSELAHEPQVQRSLKRKCQSANFSFESFLTACSVRKKMTCEHNFWLTLDIKASFPPKKQNKTKNKSQTLLFCYQWPKSTSISKGLFNAGVTNVVPTSTR